MVDLFGFDPQPLPVADGRVEADHYDTPVECVRDLVPHVNFSAGDNFMEPCRGNGNIYDNIPVAESMKCYCEIREHVDYFDVDIPYRPYDFIITNPPFSDAMRFLKKSLLEAHSVIYLLPLNYLGSRERKHFWNNNKPTHILPLSKRPVFVWVCKTDECEAKFQPGYSKPCPECGGRVAAQTDSLNYAWFCWDRAGRILVDNGLHVI